MLQQAEKTECTLAVHAGRACSSLQTIFLCFIFPAWRESSSVWRWIQSLQMADARPRR